MKIQCIRYSNNAIFCAQWKTTALNITVRNLASPGRKGHQRNGELKGPIGHITLCPGDKYNYYNL